MRSTPLATIRSRERAARGCGEFEIREIERRSGGKLPDAYVAFLRAAGSSAGDFLRGSQFDLDFLGSPAGLVGLREPFTHDVARA
jgi:hypothetical protein